ncbi:class I SAM-dependent methyltransferase [Micromonospora sp. C28SCA-DRY-2]|uniref:class I SAM-dependent methyltransferase n=1 Tax=Micromonospora sp. C28SCA-DRY-2 TaxID=3059522 RepID=UPI002676CF8C|nr:class I SAM-dependent methyltransferase [Micromonospora sp. C28SCA-DRY-2]MDO3702924.1 class I SAM-dependent methyltransferase [Micromonospora sp. C28SCA-DRY-2]
MTPAGGAHAQAQALGGRLFQASLAAAELMTVYLGVRLGLYEALAKGPATAAEFADRAGVAPRYATEWLEQQAAAGIVTVDDVTVPADRRRFTLPEGHRLALTDTGGPWSVAPLSVLPVGGIAPALPRLAEAMRAGTGVPADAYGEALRAAQAGMNRSVFTDQLPGWLRTALPDVHQALRRPGAAIADVGCGTGTSTLVLARTYPLARVHGFDRDADALATARAAVPAAAAERVRFSVANLAADAVDPADPADAVDPADPADPAGAGRFDLVCVLDALHDMARPVQVLAACRALLKPTGAVLLMEPRAAERFTAPADETERFIYTVSLLHCLPQSLVDEGSVGTGAVLRPETVRRHATAAGFARVTVLDVAHRFHRLYRLDIH